MLRFFSTTRQSLRTLPGTPFNTKQIPVPRTAKLTSEIKEALNIEVNETEPVNNDSIKTKFLDLNSDLNLHSPEGIWYNVGRSKNGNLPIYRSYLKAGGVWTEIRKVQGDIHAFKSDLKDSLNLKKNEIWVKNAAPVVVVKGDRLDEIKNILEQSLGEGN